MSYARRCLLELLGPAGDEDGLIDQVEDDRAHTEAEKLFALGHAYKEAAKSERTAGAKALAIFSGQALIEAAKEMDPYEVRDGQFVRKSDGKPVTL